MLSAALERAKLDSFARGIIVVLSGAFLAQLIPILASPLLTRLYTPEQFGLLGTFFAVVTFIGTMATGRYELALLISENRNEAVVISRLCIILAAYVSSLGTAIAFGVSVIFPNTLVFSKSILLFFCVLVCAFSYAYFQIKCHQRILNGQFTSLAHYKILFAGSVTLFQLLFAFFLLVKQDGLILGQTIGMALTAILLFSVSGGFHNVVSETESVLPIALKYKRFPLFSLPADLTNIVTNQLPAILILTLFSAEYAGLFVLTQRVLTAPISLLANSVLDVFKNKVALEVSETGHCLIAYRKTLSILLIVGVPSFILLALVAPTLFGLVFGDSWRGAGEIARVLAPMFLLRFVASPLSYVLYARQRQHHDLIWQTVLLLLTALPFLVLAKYGSAYHSIIAYSVVYCCMYLVYLCMSYKASKPVVLNGQ